MRANLIDLRRRQRRRQKIKKLKVRLTQANDPKDRERLIARIWRIHMRPPQDLPKYK